MQRRLILMRHAKSSWDSSASTDHGRPLNERGRHDAPRVAADLVARGWLPEHVTGSDSVRTRQTWSLMRPVIGEDLPESWDRTLYHAGLVQLRTAALRWPDVSTLLVLGHNPGWSHAATALSGTPVSMTTGNAALLVGEGGTWPDALVGSWELEAWIQPRDL